MTHETQTFVRDAVAALPEEFRETIVLRELHGLSYREIAAVTDAPIGTVMSRLARGRGMLAKALASRAKKE
jgi:RNA polymerase sigma-70 factor (ECF subfamily)